MAKDLKKKIFSYKYLLIIIQIFLGLFLIYFLCNEYYLLAIRENNNATLTESVDFLSRNFPFGIYGFGIHERHPDIDFIYLSYPISSYWMSGLIRKILNPNIKTTDITFFTTILVYLLIPINLGLISLKENKETITNFFKINISCLFLLTSPSFLSIFTSPDWYESYILFSTLGLLFLDDLKLTIKSSISFFLAGLSNPYMSSSLIFGAILLNLKNFRKRIDNPKSGNILRNIIILPTSKNDHNGISLIPLLFGVIIYLFLRILVSVNSLSNFENINEDIKMGSGIFTRFGFAKDSIYGGIFSIFKFLLPIKLSEISNLTKSLLSGETSLGWYSMNTFLKLFSYLIINISVLIYFLKKCIKKLTTKNYQNSIILNNAILILFLSSFFFIVIFPELASNHGLFISRIISPVIAFGLCSLIFDLSLKLVGKEYQLLLALILSWLIIIENISFFVSFIIIE